MAKLSKRSLLLLPGCFAAAVAPDSSRASAASAAAAAAVVAAPTPVVAVAADAVAAPSPAIPQSLLLPLLFLLPSTLDEVFTVLIPATSADDAVSSRDASTAGNGARCLHRSCACCAVELLRASPRIVPCSAAATLGVGVPSAGQKLTTSPTIATISRRRSALAADVGSTRATPWQHMA